MFSESSDGLTDLVEQFFEVFVRREIPVSVDEMVFDLFRHVSNFTL